MNYEEKSYEEIFEAMLQTSLEVGFISHAEEFESYIANREDISNYYVMDKSVLAEVIAVLYESITAAYESSKVEYAEGNDLDDIGKIMGITRPEAQSASCLVTFTLHEVVEEDITIEEGIIVSTEDGIEYVTVEELYFPAGETERTIQCMSVEAGVDVKVIENTLNIILSEMEYSMSCTNPNASSGGNDAFTDDEYRYLLMNWTKIRLKGSDEAYLNFFSNFEGIDGYKIVPNWDVTGTIKIIVDPGTPYQLQTIYDELQTTVAQSTEDITLFAPIDNPLNVYAVVNVDIDVINPYSQVEKEDIKTKIIQAIKIFINGGYLNDGTYYPGLEIGEDFIPHKLAVFLDGEIPELKNIAFNYPQDYIAISDEEKGVANNIVVEMI